MNQSERKERRLNLRCTRSELESIAHAAKESGKTMSEYLLWLHNDHLDWLDACDDFLRNTTAIGLDKNLLKRSMDVEWD